jgi:hypothetical protein
MAFQSALRSRCAAANACRQAAQEENVAARLLSVNVDLPPDISWLSWQGKTVHTAV